MTAKVLWQRPAAAKSEQQVRDGLVLLETLKQQLLQREQLELERPGGLP